MGTSKRSSLYLLWCAIVAVHVVISKETLPDSHTKEKNEFGFRIELFSRCSAPCGGGTQIGIYVCYNKTSSLAVEPSHCGHLNPPGRYSRVCNMRPCAYRWHKGQWSLCSTSCGEGTKQRKVKCIDRHNVKVSAWKCAWLKVPQKKRTCGVADCQPEFHVGTWSKCSSTCGEGKKTRSVICKQSLSNGTVITLSPSSCEGMVPAKTVKCKDTECGYDGSEQGYDIQGEEPLDQEDDYDASDASAVGSGDRGIKGTDPPVIQVSKRPQYIHRKKTPLSVLVGTKVWSVKGSEITVSCTATGKYPSTIKWTRDGYEITEYFEDDVGIVNGNLKIREVDRFNEGTYVCEAKSKGGISSATFTLAILVPNRPFIFAEESSKSFGPDKEKVEVTVGGKVTLFTGSSLTIKCPVIGKPTPRIWWLSKGRPISVGKAKMIGNNLVIDKIDKIYSLDYTCKARNFRGVASATTIVNVLDLSPPKINAQIKVIDTPISPRTYQITIGTNLTLMAGVSLTIRCPVMSKPTPFVSWMAKGKPITGASSRILISRDKLAIRVNRMAIADTGVYSCMAKNVAGKDTKSSYVKIVAPQPPNIQVKTGYRSVWEKGQELTVTIGEEATGLAGNTLRIVCPAKGLPSPEIAWQINRRAVSRRNPLYVIRGNTLVIKKLSRYQNGNIACTARNPMGRKTANSKVNVIDGVKPQIKSKTGRVVGDGSLEEATITIGQDLRIVENLIFRLRCPVTGFPKPKVTWSINDQDVVSSHRVLIDKINNDLIINGIQKSDTGQYVCTAGNALGEATKSSFISIVDDKSVSIEISKAKLDRTKSVAPVTIRIGDSLTALSGTDVTILCPLKGIPFPYVYWRRNGKRFEAEDFKGQFRISRRNTALKILQVSPEVAGEYECIATNVGGADRVSSTIVVVASQSPSIDFGSARLESFDDLSKVEATIGSFVRMLAGSMLSISCPSSGVPKPSFLWDFNRKPVISQGRFEVIGNTLVINQTQPSDTGRYRCTATNLVASDRRHSDVTVIAPIRPQIQGKPKDQEVLAAIPVSFEVGSTIISLEGASLQLRCAAKGLPKPKIQWKFEEIVVAGEILKLPNLDPGDSKNYTCEASNLAGVDRRVTALFVRALERPVILASEGGITSLKRFQKVAVTIGKSATILKGTVLGLICHAVGYPPPTIAWTKDTVSVRRGGGFTPFRQNSTHYGMAIDTKFNNDFSGKYECVASNAGGSVAVSSVVVVKAPTKPVVKSTLIVGSIGWNRYLDSRDPRLVTIGDNAEVLTGSEVTIRCPVTGLPAPSITWYAGRRRLTAGGKYSIASSTDLVIGNERFPTTIADSMEYRCYASNYLGRDSAVSKLKFIEPKAPRILTFTGQFEYLKKQNITMTIGAKITAITGSNITLKCEAGGLPVPKIIWTKNGAIQLQNGRQYTIDKASKFDNGSYQCKASNLAGTRSASSVITIQDPKPKTEKPKIFPSNQNIIASENKISFNVIIGSNITILEGKNLLLECPTTGLPTPQVSWYFNDKPVVRSDTLTIDPDTGTLTVIEMMKEESGRYECQSKNIAGEDVAFTYAIVVGPKAPTISVSNKVYVRLDPNRKPIKIKIGDSLTTFKGTRVTIECPSSGFPDPRTRWNKNDISLAPQIPIFINGSMIILTNPEVLDSGKYSCLASNPGGSKEASSNITFLAPQSPNITTTPGDVEFLKRGSVTIRIGSNLKVLEGDSVTILCDAKGIPTPTLSWRRNQRTLRMTRNVLRARSIRRSDSGTVTCEARNYFGRDSKTTVITVIAGQKPKIKSSTKAISAMDDLSKHSAVVGTSFKVLAGSRIRLSCSATGIPKPVYSWSVNRKPVVNNERVYVNKSTGVLDIKSVIPGDTGPAQCTATNIIGTDRSESSLNIIELRGPYIQFSKSSINTTNSVKPIRIRVGTSATALVNTTITIVCQVSGLPVPVTSWSFNDDVIKGGRVTVKGMELTIPKAQMKDGGVYACTAKSAAGQLTVKTQISLNAGQRPSIIRSDDVISEHSDFSTTSATIGSSVSLLAGAGISLQCPFQGLPKPVVLWKIDGRNVVPGENVVVDPAKHKLTISKLQKGKAKLVVTCTVVNALGAETASSDVTVIEPILPRINATRTAIVQLTNQNQVESRIGNKITILEGTSISMLCEATGLPEPEIAWTLPNIPVRPNGHVTIEGGVLKIAKAGIEDAGTFSCKATSLVGMDTAATVISVRELRGPFIDFSTKVLNLISSTKPIEMKIGSNLTALSTTNITIDCSADGFPVPVTSWRKDGEVIIKDHVRVRGSKLIITRARFADGGLYVCKAKSVAGELSVRSHLTVIAGQKPIISSSDEVESSLAGFTQLTSTIGSSISILAGSGITIICPVRGIPRPVVTWNVNSKSVISRNRVVFDNTQNSFTIPKLVSGDFGKYTCIARNILGETRATSALNVIEPFGPKIDKSGQRINVLDSQAPVTIRVGATARVLAGISITINCKAVGLPYPNISWTLDGKPLKSKGHVTVEDSKLVIVNGGSEDSGSYGCVASSPMGKDAAITRLTVHSGEKARITTVGRKVSSLDGFVNISSYIGDNITALTGSDLTIFCPTEGIPEPLVDWSRKGSPLTSDERITINPSTNALRIKNLRREDSGDFTCSAKNSRGGDQKTSVLSIIVPYGPTITKSTRSIDGLKYEKPIPVTIGDNLTALVNASIIIRCKASGLPLPKTSWTKDGVKITSKGRVTIGNEALTIQKAKLGDQGVYECTASSDSGSASASSVVVIKEPIPPTIKSSNKTVVSLTRKPLGIIIGETVRTLTRINFNITCEVEGLPKPEIIWRKNGVELPVDGRTYANGPIIYVADALTADTGFYVCEAKNVAGKRIAVSKLSIREPSVPEISGTDQRRLQELRPVTITTEIGSYIRTLEASNITLTCDARGYPPPTITWKKGVKTLDVATGNKTYTISKATTSDSGIYTCTVANLKGYDFRSSNVSIVAPKAPTIKTSTRALDVLRLESVERDVGGSLTTLSKNTIKLICNASGVPPPTLEWFKNNIKMNNRSSILTFTPARPRDSGIYSCAASNLAGMVKVDTNLTILEGKVPSIVTSEKTLSKITRIQYIVTEVGGVVNTLLSSNVEIICKASGFPKPEITWYKDGEEIPEKSPTHMVDSKTGTLMFVSLALRKAGTYKCIARNTLGTASASTVLNVQDLKHPHINSSRGIVTNLKSRKPAEIFIGSNLTVLSGTNVSITCPSGGVPLPEVTWKRGKTVLTSGGRLNVSPKVLSINRVTKSDSGRYVCSVENVMGKISIGSNLNVLDPVKPNIFYKFSILKITEYEPINVTVGARVTSIPGNQLTLTCNVSGLPVPSITWKRNTLLAQEGGSTYTVPSLKTSDSGAYMCEAINLAGVARETSNVFVIAGSKPEIITPKTNIIATEGENEVSVDIGGNITTIVGTGIEIRCTVTGKPTPAITWLRNGSVVEITSVLFVNKFTKALTLLGVALEDSGFYTCFANNTFGQVAESTYVTIFAAERPSIRFSKREIEDYERINFQITIGDNLQALVGSTVTVYCNASGNPPPEVQWFKSGTLLNSNFPLKASNNTLKIYGAMWSHTGEYECLAVNAAGSDKKTSFLKFISPEKPVILQDPSVIEVFNRTPVAMTIGNTLKTLTQTVITINCTASGIPMPTYTWTKKGTPIISSSDLEISLGGKQLTIRNLIMDDAGIYGCKAKNKAGTDSANAPILILEPILPRIESTDENITWYDRIPLSAPIGGKITALTGTQVTLTCNVIGFPEPTVTWRQDNDVNILETDGHYKLENQSLVIFAVQPSDSGVYKCFAENLAGTVKSATRLNIIDPQKPVIITSNKIIRTENRTSVVARIGSRIFVISGTPVSIACPVKGIPTPSVSWSNGGRFLYPTNNNSMLVFSNTKVSDSGEYTCTAISPIGGDAASSVLSVAVPTKPKIAAPPVGKVIPLAKKTQGSITIRDNITVFPGTVLDIKCSAIGLPKPKIIWKKETRKIKEGVLGNDTLRIRIKEKSDAGVFTCIGMNSEGTDSAASTVVVVEPLYPRIQSQSRFIVALDQPRTINATVGTTIKTLSSTTVILQCPAEGSPDPIIQWSKSGQLIVSDERMTLTKTGDLVIQKSKTLDSGEYKCLARSILGEDTAFSTVIIMNPTRPEITRSTDYIVWYENRPFKSKIGNNLTTMKGRKLTLVCPAKGMPRPKITWYRGGEKMLNEYNYVVKGNTLIIWDLSVFDTDRYTCVAENYAGSDAATSTLKVHVPVIPHIFKSRGSINALSGYNPVNVTAGQDVTSPTDSLVVLICPIKGVPRPKIIWIKDHETVISDNTIEVDCNGTLKFHGIRPKDAGEYICYIESFLGMDLALTHIKVIERSVPVIQKSNNVIPIRDNGGVEAVIGDNVTALLTQTIVLKCNATGIPYPVVTWSRNGLKIESVGMYSIDDKGTLTITGVARDGVYKCSAQNDKGTDSATSHVTVKEPKGAQIVSPRKPKTIPFTHIKNVTINIRDNVTTLPNATLTIKCTAIGVPVPSVTWSKDGNAITSAKKYQVLEDGSLVVINAVENDSGRYTCKAENTRGVDTATSLVNVSKPSKPVIDRPIEPRDVQPTNDGHVTVSVGENVTVVIGFKVLINCIADGDPKPSVVWTKDGLELKADDEYTVHANGTLEITSARTQDIGRYVCTARSPGGKDSESIDVMVVEQKKPLISRSEKPRFIPPQDKSPVNATIGDNVTVLTDSDLTIDCPATGVPEPIYSWSKDGEEISLGTKYFLLANGTLVIKKLSVVEKGAYKCTVETIAGSDSETTTVDVVEPEKPQITRPDKPSTKTPRDRNHVTMTIGDNVTALDNTSISIDCPASGIPKPVITWKKDGERFSFGNDYVVYDNGTLLIRKATLKDKGRYTCFVKNKNGEDNKTSVVDVVTPKKPKITRPKEPQTLIPKDRSPINMTAGDNVTALTGTPISIDCPASGIPKPTITWRKGGQELIPGSGYVILDNGTLVIEKATSKEKGRYTCVLENLNGKVNSSSSVKVVDEEKARINRPDKPRTIPPSDKDSVNAIIGDNVTVVTDSNLKIHCPTTGVPKPTHSWSKDGEKLDLGLKFYLLPNGTLIIRKVSVDESGTYRCTVENIAGKTSEITQVLAVAPQKPTISKPKKPLTLPPKDRKPVNISVGSNVTSLPNTPIKIVCTATGIPRPTISWLKDDKALESRDRYLIFDNGTLVIQQASQVDKGRYTCVAKNKKGEDKASSTVDVVNPEKPKITRPKEPQTLVPKDRRLFNMTIGDNVTALTGTPISIDCPASGIPKPTITWRKDGQELISGAGYVILDNGTLLTEKASAEDRGTYTCVAKNIEGEDKKSSVLDVVDPKKPSIDRPEQPRVHVPLDRNQIKMTVGDNVTAVNNTPISIDCPSSGTPKPAITWEKDNEPLDMDDGYVVFENGTLLIEMATPDDGGDYRCVIKNIEGEDSETSTVDVIGPKKPKMTRHRKPKTLVPKDRSPINMTISDNVTALTGTPISIDCPASGIPKPTITWRKDGQELIPGGGYVILDNGTLLIEKASAEDRGRYKCIATNINGEKDATSIVDVVDSEKPKISTPDKPTSTKPKDYNLVNATVGDNVTALTGTPISIDCSANGVPKPTITWRKDGQELIPGAGYVIFVNGTLLIKKASLEDRGRYTCVAKNVDGEERKSSNVNVIDAEKPKIVGKDKSRHMYPPDKRPVNIAVGDNITAITDTDISIHCPATGTPKPTTTWFKDGQTLRAEGRLAVLSNGTLVIKNASSKERGRYTCRVKNVDGEDSKRSTVDVVDSEAARIQRPKNPRNITSEDGSPVSLNIGININAITNSRIAIHCPATGTPKPTILWRENGFELVQTEGYLILGNGTLVIEKTKVNDKGQYTCVAENIAGKDSVTTNVKVLKPTAPKITRPDKPRTVPPKDGKPVNVTIGDNVTALTGTPVTIDCQATAIPKAQIIWTKDGQELRSGSGYVLYENGTLLIAQALRENRGRYRCTARNKNGDDSKTSIVDSVDPTKPKITRPDRPRSILPKDRSQINMTIGDNVTALTNTPISIDCPASGIPKPTITWRRNGQPILTGNKFVVHGNGTLFIKQATKGEGKYTCTVANPNGEDSKSSNVIVVDSKKPSIDETDPQNIPIGDGSPKTIKTGDNVTTVVGAPITIICKANGIPKPTITWYKDGREIGSEGRARVLPNNTLLLAATSLEQEGVYTCKARNIDGEDTSDSRVTLVSPRKPFILVPDVSRNIRVGNEASEEITISDNVRTPLDKKISITCKARGVPPPKIIWSKNGVVIRTGGDYEVDKNNTLILRDVKLKHSGTYTCTARNIAGEDRASSKVTVVTYSEPEIQIPTTSRNIQSNQIAPVAMTIGDNITTFSESTITIICNASGIPKPLITWLKDGRAVTPGEKYLMDQKGSLALRRSVSQDSGRYTCVATNFAGRDTRDSFVNILTPQSPSIPVAQIKQETDIEATISVDVGADVTALTDTTISIHCTASGTPNPSITWSTDGQRVNSGEFYDVLKNNTLVIREAQEDDSGVYVCTASNIFGEDKKASRVTVIEAEIPVIQRTNGDFESSDMKSVDVTVGRQVTSLSRVNINVNCTARGVPPPRIEWMNGGEMLDVVGPMLSLKNVTSTDSGKYTCVASNVAGKANASTIINITEPTTPVIQKARSELVVHKITSLSTAIGRSLEILTGSSLLLLCNATGHPTPEVRWTKYGLPIAIRDRYVINGMALRIFGVRTTDTSEITCTATNIVGEAVASSELVVKDLLRPTINTVKQQIKNFDKTKPIRVPIGAKLITTLNTTVIIRCPTKARPLAVLSWQRNGEAIVTNEKYRLNGDKSELTIMDVQFSDDGMYVCSAFNRAGTDFASIDITVATPPVIHNVRGSFEVTDIRELISITTGAVVTIPKGVSIKIRCEASGVPTPNITWYRVAEGSSSWQPIGKMNKRLYVDKDNFLSIQRSKEVDIARYICVATNVAGRDEGVTYLNIGAVPDIPGYWAAARKFTRPSVRRIETMATVIRGSTLRLRCTVYGSPKPGVTWYVVGNENRDRWKIFPDGTLQIQKVDFSDEGNYTCISKNEYGTTYRSTNVTVLVPPRILDKFFTEAYLKSKAELMYVKYSSITKLAIKRQQTRSAAVEKDGNLIIGCPVTGKPDPTILWLKNGLKVKNDSNHLVLEGVLMIRNISDAETGEYFCFVRNTAGEDGGGLDLHVRDKIAGSWKVSKWSDCQYCYGNFLGYTNRTVDCMDDRNNTVPESYCNAVPAPQTLQKCRTRSCEAIWTTSSWSPCSALCGGNGTRTRKAKCVFYKSLLPAKGLCNPKEKPNTTEPCNRAPCGQRICIDKVNYCKQIKDRNLCSAYRTWCCKTCGRWYKR